jgi:hypothetical protein
VEEVVEVQVVAMEALLPRHWMDKEGCLQVQAEVVEAEQQR